jgi:WD40 repeat protein
MMAPVSIVLLILCASLIRPTAAAITEVVLCEADPSIMSGFVASPDARHLAWVEENEGRERVVLDGAPGPYYESVSDIVFSEDGDHMAYVAGTSRTPVPGVNYAIVCDGVIGESYERVSVPQMDLHGRVLAYFAETRNAPVTLVVNGSPRRPGDTIVEGSLVLSREGGRFAFMVKQKESYDLVTDAGVRGSYKSIFPTSVEFSPDGEHLSFVVPALEPVFFLDEKRFDRCDEGVLGPVYDSVGKSMGYALRYKNVWRVTIRHPARVIQFETTDNVSDLMLSPSGEHFAHLRTRPLGKMVVVLDTVTVGEYDRVEGLTFSPDGKHLAFAAGEGNRWRVVYGGDTTGLYESVHHLVVSPSGGHWACWTGNEGKWRCVVDGIKGRTFDATLSRIVFDNESQLRYIARRRNTYYRVNVSLDR